MPLAPALGGGGSQRGQGARQVMIQTCVCDKLHDLLVSPHLLPVPYLCLLPLGYVTPEVQTRLSRLSINTTSSPAPTRHKTKLLEGDLFCVGAFLCY